MPTILIVDDDGDIRGIMTAVLRMKGYRVVEAANGLQGLEKLDSLAGRPLLVISDCQMPIMSGSELATRIKRRYPSVPILAVSSAAHDCGHDVDERLSKPFELDELLAAVERLLRMPASA